MSHSLKNFRDPLFLYRKITFGLFFFPTIFGMIFVFFFPRKSLPSLTHSIEKRVFFFPGTGKKNGFFTHSLDFHGKIPKKQTIPGKKKLRYLWGEGVNFFLNEVVKKFTILKRRMVKYSRRYV